MELEVELTNEAGNTIVQKRIILADKVAKAQRIIASAVDAGRAEQDRAIKEAIQLLYPYPP